MFHRARVLRQTASLGAEGFMPACLPGWHPPPRLQSDGSRHSHCPARVHAVGGVRPHTRRGRGRVPGLRGRTGALGPSVPLAIQPHGDAPSPCKCPTSLPQHARRQDARRRASQNRVRGAGRGKTGRGAGAPLELPLTTQPHGDAPSPRKRPVAYASPQSALLRHGAHTLRDLGTALRKGT